jgi:CBS domain-containing protein
VRLVDLLSPRRVVVPLQAATLADGMRILVDACVADGRVADRARLDQAIRESWPEDTMSIGPHAWLPHFRTDAVRGVVVALGIAPAELTAPGSEPGRRMVLLVIASPGEAAGYLQTVAAFARALARPEVATGLLAAGSAEEILRLSPLAEIELQGNLLVRDIMTTQVVSVGPDLSLGEAARILMSHGVESVPVVASSGEVLGLLSHRELLRHLVPSYVQQLTTGELPAAARGVSPPRALDPRGTPVREAMARNVLCVAEDQSVADVAQLLAAKDVGRVPVVKDGVLRGFLTRQDIVRKVLGR